MRHNHELKTWPEYFGAVRNGRKTFEIRKNDRGFKVDDNLLLREYNPKTEEYTGRQLVAKVTYVLENETFLQPGYAALGLMIISHRGSRRE